jgi:serine protease Do
MMKHLRIFHGVLAVAGIGLFIHPLAAQEPVRTLDEVRKLESKITTFVDKALPATVALISVETGASGSGVITTPDGLILTAAHVVEGNEQVEVVFPNGRQTKAKVLGANLSKDIALAKIVDPGPWPYVEMGQSKPLKAGDWVIAMGHSAGYDPARTPPVRFGRVVSDGPGNFLTTDCSLIGGDSGGPLFGIDGKVVAVNSSIGESIKNNNHAGVDGFREDWDRLMKSEIWGELQMNPLANQERPVMGIRVSEQQSEAGIPVASVTPGTPAARAGIRPGDVIQSINGAKARAGRYFFLQIAKYRAGDTIKVGLLRDSKSIEMDVKLVQAAQLGQTTGPLQRLNLGNDDDNKVDVPLMTLEEEQATKAESKELYDAIKPATKTAGESAVWIWGIDRRDKPVQLVQGTVIGDGRQVLTKWSEVMLYVDSLSVVAGNAKTVNAKVTGVYPDDDLAVLQLEDPAGFTPVKWDTSDSPHLGRFIIAAAPGDRAPTLGVVAVETRSLRTKDQAFLGVELDGNFNGPGVRIRKIEAAGAAQIAGLLEGDVILKVAGKGVNSAFEMRTSLNGHGPGESIELVYDRDGKQITIQLVLKERPEFPQAMNSRLETMRRMGTDLSAVTTDFPSAMQTDMPIDRRACGGPVVDLDGKVIGISIARTDRTASLIIPSTSVVSLLSGKSSSKEEAEAANAAKNLRARTAAENALGQMMPRGSEQVPENSAESLRQNLDDMARLLERMKREMKEIGE